MTQDGSGMGHVYVEDRLSCKQRSLDSDNHSLLRRDILLMWTRVSRTQTGGGMMDGTDDGDSFCERGLRVMGWGMHSSRRNRVITCP